MTFIAKRLTVSLPLTRSLTATRLLSTTRAACNSHHDEHHEEAVNENFGSNPQYLWFLAGLVSAGSVLYLDNNYRESHNGLSWFAKFINVTPREHIDQLQAEYNKRIDHEKQIFEVMFLNEDPKNKQFGRIGGVGIVPRGSPFNAEPGDTKVDLDNLEPRRVQRSIFD